MIFYEIISFYTFLNYFYDSSDWKELTGQIFVVHLRIQEQLTNGQVERRGLFLTKTFS